MAIDKNAVIKEAQKFTAKGQYAKAIAEWKKLVREFPNDANIFNTIGDLCLKKDAKAEAVDAYKKAADILAADGFSSKAIALYKKILNIDPKKIEVHLALADLNAEKGLTGNALESYKFAADYYTQKNEMVKALDIYQKMADLNPSNVGFRLKLADLYIKEGLKKEATKAYLEAANVHMSKDAFQDARQIFEKVLTLDPNNKEVYHKAGIVYFKEGKFVEACKAFKPAFDADPANQELINLYLEALSKADRAAEAEEVLKKLLSQDAARMDLREKLYHVYRSKKEYDKALTEAAAIADAKVENREYDEAVELLKGFVSENPANIAGRRKLSEIYGNIRREEDAARELFQIADLLIAGGDRDGARETLVRAAEIAPDMAEARQRLESLEAAPVAPPLEEQAPAAAPAQASLEQAAATFETGSPFEAGAPAPAMAQPAAEEDPAVMEAFTEIDVLIKYGLAGKAVEQLEGLTGKFPESLQVRTRLRDLYREQGNTKKAVEYALLLADLYSQRGMSGQTESVLRDALEIEPNNPAVMARLGISPAPAAPPAEAQPFPPPLTEEGAFPGPAFGEQPPASAEEFTAHTGEGPAIEWQPPAPEITEEAFAETPADIREDLIVQISKQASAAREPLAQEIDISEVWAEAEFFYQQGLFDEARRHYEKILEVAPSDKRALGRIAEISREKEEVQEFSKLAEAVEGLEAFVPSGAPEKEAPLSASDEEAVRTLMEEIKQLNKPKAPPPPPKKEPVPPSRKKTEPKKEEPIGFEPAAGKRAEKKEKRREEDFFDLGAELRSAGGPVPSKREESSDEFFDLAAELRDELGSAALPEKQADSSGEQSLDDIFEEFKKGVEEQAGREDSDTHYNLGIAYKEMGLLEEAISEFKLTHEGEPKFVESRYMLGLCFMEQGDYYKAIAEIGNALNYSESLSGDGGDRASMHYDLALAYQGAGNMNEAMSEFQKVSNLDPGYLDTAAKLKEMEKGEFISLDQLKEDIEKEISSKFFEEGERIEREEKIRKNEKMRS
jgi:tetratricopeptide (TPR) repeat protein